MTIPIGTLSYAAAAAAYCFLSVLLVTSWRGRLPGALLMLATALTAIWAGTLAYQAMQDAPWRLIGELLEIGHKTAWLVFLLVLLGYARHGTQPADAGLRRIAIGILGGCAVALLLTVALRVPPDADMWRGWRSLASMLLPALLALVGILLVEHLYRNTNPQQRWSLKFLCLGLGAFFAFDFYLFSDALLFRRINPDIWSARGVVAALVVPLLAVSAARNPTWSLDVSVSRQFVLHSTTLLAASVYLLVMATAGYYIRYFGGTWGGLLQVSFLFGAGVLLVLALFSGTLRARFKIFLSKHFFSYRYDYREEWLRFTRTLSEADAGAHVQESCVRALAQLVESPGGALWLKQESGRFECVAQCNFAGVAATAIEVDSLMRFLEKRQWVIDLTEYRRNTEVYEGLEIPDWLSALPQAWLVVPLGMHERLEGFVVLARSRGRVSMNWEISDLLRTAARQAAAHVAQARAAEALARSKQFESFNKMSAFVVHDLKNLVAQLSLLLRNAQRHKHNPEFQEDMLGTIEASVNKMNRILMQLRSGGLPIEAPTPIRLSDVVERAVASKAGYRPVPRLQCCGEDLWVTASAERLERVVGHLVQNAVEATPPDGEVDVRVVRQGTDALIEVHDNGRGMSKEFVRDSLFKPFESTKRTGMGIGTYESREYIRELGGRMEVCSETGKGSTFSIVLPVARRAPTTDQITLHEGVG